MPANVHLKDIVDALEMMSEEFVSYLDLDSGKVHTVSMEVFLEVEQLEEGEEDEDEGDSERRSAKAIFSGNFKPLPTKFDVHEWSIMQDFTLSRKPGMIRDDLEHAIHGAGAFRHFKDHVRRHGIESAWFAFRDESLRQIAIRWCEEHKIKWVKGPE